MKAVVVERYGPPEVVEITDVPKPVPKRRRGPDPDRRDDGELGRCADPRAAGAAGPGAHDAAGAGLFGPKQQILGFDCAGEVEAVGKNVALFKPGDRVVASQGFKYGCHAEYRAVPEDGASRTSRTARATRMRCRSASAARRRSSS